MSEQAERLLQRYNEWRRQTAHYQLATHPMRDLSPSPRGGPDRIAELDRLIAWCSGQGIDPERWLYTMFAAYRWQYCPPFQNLIPRNPKKTKTYQLYFEDRETPEFNRVVRRRIEAAQESEGLRFDPNRDLSHSAEHLKRQYLDMNDAETCMADAGRTLGHHPRSVACARCPVQRRCAEALQSRVPFNILALRRGEITAEQAYAVGQHVPSR